MKNIVFLCFVTALVWSCGNGENKPTEGENKTTQTDPTKHRDYKKGFDLVAKSDCFTCHSMNDKVVGPAYAEVAKKYAGQTEMVDTLAQRIINGSIGHWGQVQMTAHPNLSLEDARAMVKYVMTLNQ
ncbi:MAG: c-type cytochrome [Chitinophagaceae bacterium]|nr:MAG: c-type cytochrome [Chitinophagaceae bacterium]